VSRFSQAISEGDGISVIPLLEGDVAGLAVLAEEAGAEAVAVWSLEDVAAVRSQCSLPVLVRDPQLVLDEELRSLSTGDADACVLVYERFASDEDLIERLYERLTDERADCVVDVRDEEQLEEALERVDPEVILISEREADEEKEDLERTLDLLPDVPAGKLVISEAGLVAREQVVALERAGVDAVLVGAGFLRDPDFAAALAELTGRAEAL
jgi:indole-3-glycerol phosphate synthase